jgi:uncharacterized repeat protein (TIGR03803 family)
MGFLLRLGKFWNESPFRMVVTRGKRRRRSRCWWARVHLKQRLAAVPPGLEQLEDRLTPSGYALKTLASVQALPLYNSAYPSIPIVDRSGNLFGTTGIGVSPGVVFEVKAGSGAATTLASFSGTNDPKPSAVIEDSSGNLFGTAAGGTYEHGQVFEVKAGSGTITTLASFDGVTDGNGISGGLVEDSSGNLFGTTYFSGGGGSVFEVKAGTGTITILASINPSDGNPVSPLFEDSQGNLFGTTLYANGAGQVFELKAGSGAITTLASLGTANAIYPNVGVIVDSSGDLFGCTGSDSAANAGSVFEIPAGGALTTLASFDGADGKYPYGVIEDSSGNLFGTTSSGGAYHYGTVFEVTAGSGTITTLASFNPGSSMSQSCGAPGLVEDTNGNFYGTTWFGGAFDAGTVFELFPEVSRLQVTTQPPSQITNGAKFDVQVSAEGANGNVDLNFTSSVTIALANNPGNATLGGTLTENAVNGVADFPDLTLNATGAGYTLQATSPGLNAVTTAPIQIADQLVTTTQPPTQVINRAKFDVQVSAEDTNGNVDPHFTGAVTMALANNPSGATLGGTLTVNAVHGVADFPNLTLNTTSTGYTLQAASPGQVNAATTSITVVDQLVAGTVFQDINGNGVQDSGEPGLAGQTVYLDLAGSGTLQSGDPTATTDANGNF